jgi:hypothetical protein
MFNHRYFGFRVEFASWLASIQEELNMPPRFVGFAVFAHDALGWFQENPKLEQLSLKCVVIPEASTHPFHVRIRHHVVLVGPAVESTEYAIDNLPWKAMGNGVFELNRSDELVQAYLALPDEDTQRYAELVMSLAARVNAVFEEADVIHDIGLESTF